MSVWGSCQKYSTKELCHIPLVPREISQSYAALHHSGSSFWFTWRLLQVKEQVTTNSPFMPTNWSTALTLVSPSQNGEGMKDGGLCF